MQLALQYVRNKSGHLTCIAVVDSAGAIDDVYNAEEVDALLAGVREHFNYDPYCDKLPTDQHILQYIQEMDNRHASIGCM